VDDHYYPGVDDHHDPGVDDQQHSRLRSSDRLPPRRRHRHGSRLTPPLLPERTCCGDARLELGVLGDRDAARTAERLCGIRIARCRSAVSTSEPTPIDKPSHSSRPPKGAAVTGAQIGCIPR
jgi:hypothetical protein